jgi:membrane protein
MKLTSRAGAVVDLFKQTATEWIADDAPQFGAALAYYSVFSLAPLVLVSLAVIGFVFRENPADAWEATHPTNELFCGSKRDPNGARNRTTRVVAKEDCAWWNHRADAGPFWDHWCVRPVAERVDTIWGVKAKPERGIWGFVRSRFLSFALLAGIAFLLLVSLVIEAVINAFSR